MIPFGILFMIIGCGPASMVMPEYKDKVLSAKHIVVASDSVKILCKDDVDSDIGYGNPDDVYKRFFEDLFPGKIKQFARVDQISFLKGILSDTLKLRILPIRSNKSMKIALPDDGVRLKTDSLAADYILFINEYSINHIVTGGTTTANGVPMAGFDDLIHKLNFAIWDNTKGSLVSYGQIESKTGFGIFRKARSVWQDCIEELAQEIMKSSPFRIATASPL
jgi:hypothetical protein